MHVEYYRPSIFWVLVTVELTIILYALIQPSDITNPVEKTVVNRTTIYVFALRLLKLISKITENNVNIRSHTKLDIFCQPCLSPIQLNMDDVSGTYNIYNLAVIYRRI